MGRRSALALAMALVSGVVLAQQAQQPQQAPQTPLPEARTIVDRYVTAIGGAAAFKAIQSIRAGGRLEIAEQHIGGDVELLSARPAKLSYRVTIPGIGQIANGYDGRTGWALSLLTGPEVFSGRQLSEAADDAWFDAPL